MLVPARTDVRVFGADYPPFARIFFNALFLSSSDSIFSAAVRIFFKRYLPLVLTAFEPYHPVKLPDSNSLSLRSSSSHVLTIASLAAMTFVLNAMSWLAWNTGSDVRGELK